MVVQILKQMRVKLIETKFKTLIANVIRDLGENKYYGFDLTTYFLELGDMLLLYVSTKAVFLIRYRI